MTELELLETIAECLTSISSKLTAIVVILVLIFIFKS